MKENKYDDAAFFEKYASMYRSQKGLEGAGEWAEVRKLFPPLEGKRMLDLGCGYGWHSAYASDNKASAVVAVDISSRMLEKAKEMNFRSNITYINSALEDFEAEDSSFDFVFSSLTLHYVDEYDSLVKRVYSLLKPGGDFLFSVEHPVFTAEGSQDWIYDEKGAIRCFPVDNYYIEGKRDTLFLGERVVKYHRTITSYISPLLECGFSIKALVEPQPPEDMRSLPGFENEMRRPMMLIVKASK